MKVKVNDLEGYTPVNEQQNATPSKDLQPVFNSMLRCPLPPVTNTPDSLRQFYLGGQVPQVRLLTPPNSIVGSTGGGTIIQKTTVVSTTNSSGSGTSTQSKSVSAVLKTPVLAPNAQYLGTVQMAKGFLLLSASADGPARIEVYGTSVAQSVDASRGLDVAPVAGVFQNLITDVALDTVPYQWNYQNRIAANADNPQSTSVYVTVTNLDSAAHTVTATIFYVPLES